MIEVAIAFIVGLSAIAFAKPHLGMHCTLVMAIVQDPLRKLTAGEPPIFITFCGVVFASMVLRFILKSGSKGLFQLAMFGKWTKALLIIFFFLLVVQGANSFLRFNNVLLTGLGFVSFVLPLLAIGTAFHFVRSFGVVAVVRFFRFYTILSLFAVSTIILERWGIAPKMLGEVGVGIWISSHGGLEAYSGLYRAAEVAAWHAATTGCMAMILLTIKGVSWTRLLMAIAIFAIVTSLGVLTGRRKFILYILIFIMSYYGLMLLFIRHARSQAFTVLAMMAVAYLAVDFTFPEDNYRMGSYELYLARTQTAFESSAERFENLGIQSVQWAVNRFGWFGVGLGTGTQGAAHITDSLQGLRGAAEGGLGRLTMELGVPGMVLSIIVALGIAMNALGAIQRSSFAVRSWGRICCGLAAMIAANLAQFSVATQIYGDFFVMIFLGFLVGAVLGINFKSKTRNKELNATQLMAAPFNRANAAKVA